VNSEAGYTSAEPREGKKGGPTSDVSEITPWHTVPVFLVCGCTSKDTDRTKTSPGPTPTDRQRTGAKG